MLPAFVNKPVVRRKPLYWRTRVAKPSCRVAMRIGDWKIVANDKLTKFQLFNLRDDWKETTDLSKQNPTKFTELKETLVALDAEVKAEGPQWPEPPPKRKARKK